MNPPTDDQPDEPREMFYCELCSLPARHKLIQGNGDELLLCPEHAEEYGAAGVIEDL